ncbi:hypothetical protein FB565_005237 [Actinoplanes lutulentus]|uniref:Uncharacterized protein DUF4262 n=1 Tax=Actinoplanes lutulentus TaxID=1287878 RepID=A0A327ZI04_9ACTN|nr:DUF4262 domain-containing protein [Actinoplanes lutulentus]MBB2945504.1 hypothetical protein [Actinoplanes lutulentus]RAK40364.1 uncharacterized protein DUF4262 [Actinoplanes lutulentus]
MDLDDFFDEQSRLIDKYGWTVVHVEPTEEDPPETVPFGYTVGLTELGHPEIAIAGVTLDVTGSLLNEVAWQIRHEGLRLGHGRRLTGLIAGHDLLVVAGEPTDEVFPGSAMYRYGEDRVRLCQLVWPDPDDRFPWQTGYQTADWPQPTIGVAPVRAARRCAGFRGFPQGRTRRVRF